MIKKLARCVREYKLAAICTPLVMIGEALMEVLIPYHMADLIDYGINPGNMAEIKAIGFKLLLLAFASLCFGILGGVLSSYASAGFAKNVRHDLYEKIQTFSFSNIDKFTSSGLITRMTTDVNKVQMAFMMVTRMAFRAPSMLLFALILSFRVNKRLSLIFLAIAPILAIVIVLGMKVAMPLFRKMFKIYDRLNAVVQENLRGIRVVKAFVQEESEKDKFRDVSEGLYNISVKVEKLMALMSPVMQLAINGSTLLLCWIGAKMVVSSTMTTGQLMSLLNYVSMILTSMMMLTAIFVMAITSKASAERISEVLDEESDIVNCEDPIFEVANGSIEFDHVSFAYPGSANALNDLNFSIDSGETVGIIGSTGSGKSSLVQLIPRLYDVSEGSVKIGGTDVRSIDLTTLRTAVSMVLQKNVLFSGTIEENLRWGKADATEEEMIRACKLAGAYEFVERLPEGLRSELEQGAANLSGGQRQRLCIARAVLAGPKVLILDDSTSAVDTATEAGIREALRSDLKDSTKIIIAQRISSVKEADRIIVMDDGAISGIGTHDELMENNEIYREVYESQMRGGDFDAPK